MTVFALIAALSMLATAHAGCPQYASIAQKTAFEFDPRVYEGIWYQIATDEPTMPSICQCATLNWTVTGPGTFQDTFSARCGPKNISFALAGRLSKNESEPGSLFEGFNSYLEVPNMVFNLTLASDGRSYEFASVYSCLGLGFFSLQILSRTPVVDTLTVQAFIDAAHGIGLDVSKVKIYDFTPCGY